MIYFILKIKQFRPTLEFTFGTNTYTLEPTGYAKL
jgi:hypothetical protein